MGRFERALGILLHLRSGKEVSAFDLAQHFGVSRRTIYRDMEMLSALGVPVYAERGHAGGFRLLGAISCRLSCFQREKRCHYC
jgi:predicted DNA-binding transcriptional regulator YafY